MLSKARRDCDMTVLSRVAKEAALVAPDIHGVRS
jgi:hypothetical protein